MQQVHAEGAVRHAEKRRRGTCEFANRIARVSLEAYDATVPESYREVHRQTCVAAIVACFKLEGANGGNDQSNNCQSKSDNSSPRDYLQLMGLGAGTKFLSERTLKQEQQSFESYGKRIRDCHAEVLARRAFQRQLLEEILADLHGNPFAVSDYVPILERVAEAQSDVREKDVETDHQSKQCVAKRFKSGTLGIDNKTTPISSTLKFRLKPNVTLHFYASSAPCGNAALKKFVKMEKEVFDTSLRPNQWPQQVHTPIASHSLRLGQFALLVKKDSSLKRSDDNQIEYKLNDCADTSSVVDTALLQQQQTEKRPKSKPWPYRQDDEWCPPSCSITNFNMGTIHSCSDKLLRWNCLGLQGSLLMSILEEPVYISTLTVGRKFSRAICQRAVCCRAEGFQTCGLNKYQLNHPVLMETNVYMDETGTHSMEGVRAIGQDASFDSSNSCWAWWPERTLQFGYKAECIDGKTGLPINHDDTAATSSTSEVSTASQLEMLQNIGLSIPSTSLSLEDMVTLKHILSPGYEAAKDVLLRHRVLREWSCRFPRK